MEAVSSRVLRESLAQTSAVLDIITGQGVWIERIFLNHHVDAGGFVRGQPENGTVIR
jgi:hypothetical protein